MTDILAAAHGSNVYWGARYAFAFNPQGTGAPTGVKGKFIASITRKSTGLFLVTFMSNFAAIESFDASVQSTSGGALSGVTVQIDSTNTNLAASGGAVLAVALVTPVATAAYSDFTGAATDLIYCDVVFSTNSTITP